MPERACAGQVRGVDSLRKEYRNVLDRESVEISKKVYVF